MNSLVKKFLNVKLDDLIISNVDNRSLKTSQGVSSEVGLYNFKKTAKKPTSVWFFDWIKNTIKVKYLTAFKLI